jgi:hypothetical protein
VDGTFHAIDNTCIHGLWRVKRESRMVSLVYLVFWLSGTYQRNETDQMSPSS